MAKLLFTLFLILTSFFTHADAWDNLTLEEANEVSAYLAEHPFVFDFCDCCDSDEDNIFEAELIKITSTRIEKCSWDDNYYSVRFTAERVAKIIYHDDLSSFTVQEPDIIDTRSHPENWPIYMNYTWGINPTTKQAHPLFDMIEYTFYEESPGPCKPNFNFPSPKELQSVYKDKDYKNWWTKFAKQS